MNVQIGSEIKDSKSSPAIDKRLRCLHCDFVAHTDLLASHIQNSHNYKERSAFGKNKNKPNPVKVNCPLCDHRTYYNVLFTHIQSCHSEKSPKLVMAKFNREYRERCKIEKMEGRDLDRLVTEHENPKQPVDEPRDTAKYIGL